MGFLAQTQAEASVQTPSSGWVELFQDGDAWKYKTSTGAVFTLATGVTLEQIQDLLATSFADTSTITWVYDDPANVFRASIETSVLATINSAVQPGANISVFTNDVGYVDAAGAAAAAPVQSVNGETGAVIVKKMEQAGTVAEVTATGIMQVTSGVAGATAPMVINPTALTTTMILGTAPNFAAWLMSGATGLVQVFAQNGMDLFNVTKLINVPAGTAATDGINKGQLDAHINDLGDPHTQYLLEANAPPTSWAQGFNTDTTTNLNVGATWATNVPVVGTYTDDGGGDFTQNGTTGIDCNFNGEVEVQASLHLTSVVQRANARIRTKLAGTPTGPVGNDYIRAASGHNESQPSIITFRLTVTSGQTIGIGSDQEAAAGTVTMALAGSSHIYIKRVS